MFCLIRYNFIKIYHTVMMALKGGPYEKIRKKMDIVLDGMRCHAYHDPVWNYGRLRSGGKF